MNDVLLALLRAAHGLTAAVWLGLSIAAVLSPAVLATARASGWSLRSIAQVSLWALVVTGAILTLDRLANPAVSTQYVLLLGLKLAMVGAMGLLALAAPSPESTILPRRGHRARRVEPAPGRAAMLPAAWRYWLASPRLQRLLLALGIGAYVLGSLLTSVYEADLRSL